MSLMCIYFTTEPTGNIAPKLPGKKYEGGKIETSPLNSSVFIICDVVGYPVPLYRLVYWGLDFDLRLNF